MDKNENYQLRKLLWLNHGCSIRGLYGDDGEMQCSGCLIDFKRDSVKDIERHLTSARHIDGEGRCPECEARRKQESDESYYRMMGIS